MDFKDFLKLKPDLLRSIAKPDAIYQSTITGNKSNSARAIVAERENVNPNSLKYRSELAQQADAALFGTAATAGVVASGSTIAPTLKVAIAQYAAPAANIAASLATQGMVYDMAQKSARILFGDDTVDSVMNTIEPVTMFTAIHPLEVSNAFKSLSLLKGYAQIKQGEHNMKSFKKLATAYVNDPEHQEFSVFSKPEVRKLYLNEYMPKGITPKTFEQAYNNAKSIPATATEVLNNPGSIYNPNKIQYLEHSAIPGWGTFPKGKKGGKLYPEDIAKLQEYVDKLALKQAEEGSVYLFNVTPKSWDTLAANTGKWAAQNNVASSHYEDGKLVLHDTFAKYIDTSNNPSAISNKLSTPSALAPPPATISIGDPVKAYMDLHPQKNDLIPANVKRTSIAVIDKIISSSRANINNGDISIRPEEYPSIRRYTSGSYQLNTYFGNRGKSPASTPTFGANSPEDLVQFARGISKESRAYPLKTDGMLLRGLTDSEIQLMLDSYFNKSPYKPNTHMSTTVDPTSHFVASGLRSVAAIQQKTPVPYVAPISRYPNEKEVLIPRGMQYNVTGVRTFNSPRTGKDLLFFTLKEIYKPK